MSFANSPLQSTHFEDYHRTADNVAVPWLSPCSDPKLGMDARVRYSHNAFFYPKESLFRDHFPLAFHEPKEIEDRKENKSGRVRMRDRITDTRYGSENQTKKKELARMGIEPMAFGLALRHFNHRQFCKWWMSPYGVRSQHTNWSWAYPPFSKWPTDPRSICMLVGARPSFYEIVYWATETHTQTTTFNFIIIILPPTLPLPDFPAAVIQSSGWLSLPDTCGTLFLPGGGEATATLTLSAVQWKRSWMWWLRCGVSVAQWLERRSANPKALGSIPIRANSIFLVWFWLPQRVSEILCIIFTLPRFLSFLPWSMMSAA